jgi:ATP-dependent protease ClpP protease subunit
MSDTLMNTAKGYSGPNQAPKDHIFSLSDNICKESFEKLVQAYNNMADGDTIYIYLNSVGGDCSFMQAVIDIINQNCDITVLIAYGEIYSAAFEIFFRTVCERRILPGTSGMAHFSRLPVWIVREGVPMDEWSKYFTKWANEDFKRTVSYYQALGFNKLESKSLKENKDVFFNETRLRTLLRNHIKLINAGYN